MTVSEPASSATQGADQQAIERRLHPFSWLFVLLMQLRSFALPLIVFVLFGKGDSWVFYGIVGAVAFALYSLIYSLSFRYRIGDTELLVRAGIVFRTERHVPYARIQNIVQKRNPLHRIFGVTELRLESAGGSEPEAVMNVITLKAAAELEQVLKHRRDPAISPGEEVTEPETPWHTLSGSDLFRLGLINDRGWVAVGALAAVYWQAGNDYWPWPAGQENWNPWRVFFNQGEQYVDSWSQAMAAWTSKGVAILALVLLALVLIKLLSIAMAFLSFYRFRLAGDGTRLSTEAGLLTRHVASARRDKIQRLIVGESWLARRLQRRWLSCEVAAGAQIGGDGEQQSLRLRWLAPVGSIVEIEQIAARVLPGLDLANLQWQPLHPHAWRRIFKTHLFWMSLLMLPVVVFVTPWVLPIAALATLWIWFYARGWAGFAAYACDGQHIAWRAGWWRRQWAFAKIEKGQTVAIEHNPFDRRRGMHTVSIDTAGARFDSFALSIPYLPIDEARALAETLRLKMTCEPA